MWLYVVLFQNFQKPGILGIKSFRTANYHLWMCLYIMLDGALEKASKQIKLIIILNLISLYTSMYSQIIYKALLVLNILGNNH